MSEGLSLALRSPFDFAQGGGWVVDMGNDAEISNIIHKKLMLESLSPALYTAPL